MLVESPRFEAFHYENGKKVPETKPIIPIGGYVAMIGNDFYTRGYALHEADIMFQIAELKRRFSISFPMKLSLRP